MANLEFMNTSMLNKETAAVKIVLRRKQAKPHIRAPRLRRGYRDLCILKESEWLDLRAALEDGRSQGSLVEVLTCPPEDTFPEHHGKILDGSYKRLKKP